VATATVSFSRTMGGVVGVTILGSILNGQLASRLSPQLNQLAKAGYQAIESAGPTVANQILDAYSQSMKILFISAAPVIAIGFFLGWFYTNKKMPSVGKQTEPVL